MIDPLYFNAEQYPAYEIDRHSFCTNCLSSRNSRNNPGLATTYCRDCAVLLGNQKEYGALLCQKCDSECHKMGPTRYHRRQIIVVGPGLRKRVLVRGDGVNYPKPLDKVSLRMRALIYSNGKRTHRLHSQKLNYTAGISGKSVHVQVLGARDISIGDANMTSDPFVVYNFCGKPLGSTRVRPRTLNPRWNNETFIVPMDEHMATPRDMMPSQKDVVKFEVFDFDYVTSNEFLGHVIMTRSKLMKLAVVTQEKPIRIPLTMKEYNGILNMQIGFNTEHFFVKINNAEDLEKRDVLRYHNPYVKIFIGENLYLGATPAIIGSINPIWTTNNEFKLKLSDFFVLEETIKNRVRFYRASNNNHMNNGSMRPSSASTRPRVNITSLDFEEFDTLPDYLSLVRLEIYHKNRFSCRKDWLLGKATIHIDNLRKMLPSLPQPTEQELEQFKKHSYINDITNSKSRSMIDSLRPMISNISTQFSSMNMFRSKAELAQDHSMTMDMFQRSGLLSEGEFSPEQPANSQVFTSRLQSPEQSGLLNTARDHLLTSQSSIRRPPLTSLASPLTMFLKKNPQHNKNQEIIWSDSYRLQITRQSYKSSMGAEEQSQTKLGYLIVRLLIANRGEVITGIDQAVQQMTVGETSLVRCRYDYAYGSFCLANNIPPRSNVIFHIKVLEVNGKGMFRMPVRQLKRAYRTLGKCMGGCLSMLKDCFGCCYVCSSTGMKRKKRRRKRKKNIFTKLLACLSSIPFCSLCLPRQRSNPLQFTDEDDEDSDYYDESSDDDSLTSYDENEENENDQDEYEEERLLAEQAAREEQEKLSKLHRRQGKVDSRMKKHYTPSVHAGAKLLWNFKESGPLPPSKSHKENLLLPPSAPGINNDNEYEGYGEGEGDEEDFEYLEDDEDEGDYYE